MRQVVYEMMDDTDIKRLASIRAVYAAANPPYTDIVFLLRVLDEVFADCSEWTEIVEMVQAALSDALNKSPDGFMPMAFNDAIRRIAKQRDEAVAAKTTSHEAAGKWAERTGRLANKLFTVREMIEAIDPFQNSRENIAERLNVAMTLLAPAKKTTTETVDQ